MSDIFTAFEKYRYQIEYVAPKYGKRIYDWYWNADLAYEMYKALPMDHSNCIVEKLLYQISSKGEKILLRHQKRGGCDENCAEDILSELLFTPGNIS